MFMHMLYDGTVCTYLCFRYGTFGFITEYGAEKKISKYSSVLATVSVGVPTGVILKIK